MTETGSSQEEVEGDLAVKYFRAYILILIICKFEGFAVYSICAHGFGYIHVHMYM